MHEVSQEQIKVIEALVIEADSIATADELAQVPHTDHTRAEVFRVLLECHRSNKQMRQQAEQIKRLAGEQSQNIGGRVPVQSLVPGGWSPV